MMGSDFDGIPTYIQDLEHTGQYPRLIETLLHHYDEKLVRGWLWDNAMSYLGKHLPEGICNKHQLLQREHCIHYRLFYRIRILLIVK